MAQKTGQITYNLTDRGYRYHGKPRNFNTARVAQMINSPATQERINGRAMLGFYGHWPRQMWGAVAAEGGVDANGKQIVVEPAFVTTHLEARPDGTIIHEQEFIDNEPGQACQRLHKSRTGGFSSVIDEVAGYIGGFDYVLDPNYRNNRGYTLDSATGGMVYDDAHGVTVDQLQKLIHMEQVRGINLILDNAEMAIFQRDELLRKKTDEVEELLSLLARRDPATAAVFDSAHMASKSDIVVLDTAAAEDLLRLSNDFMHSTVGEFASDKPKDEAKTPALGGTSAFLRRLVMG